MMEIGCHPGDDGHVFVGVYAPNKIEVHVKQSQTKPSAHTKPVKGF